MNWLQQLFEEARRRQAEESGVPGDPLALVGEIWRRGGMAALISGRFYVLPKAVLGSALAEAITANLGEIVEAFGPSPNCGHRARWLLPNGASICGLCGQLPAQFQEVAIRLGQSFEEFSAPGIRGQQARS